MPGRVGGRGGRAGSARPTGRDDDATAGLAVAMRVAPRRDRGRGFFAFMPVPFPHFHVVHIVLMGSEIQMAGIAAISDITTMKDPFSFRNRPDQHFPDKAMCLVLLLSGICVLAISALVNTTLPQPAFAGETFFYFIPEC